LSVVGPDVSQLSPLSASDIGESVRFEKVRLLFRNIPTNILATLVGALLFAYTQSKFVDHSLLVNWVVLLFAIALARIGSYFAYRITATPNKRIWEYIFVIGALTTSTVWSSAIFFLTAEGNMTSQILSASIIMALAAGSVSTLSYLRLTGIGFFTILMLPLILITFLSNSEFSLYLTVVYLLFYLSLLIASIRFNEYITESITLRYASINDAIEINSEKEKAEQANAAKSIFLSSMSHELRTPLNAIMGFTQIMKINRNDKLTSDQTRNLDEIMSASESLLSLIDDILDLSQVESGEFSSEPANLNVDEAISGCIPLVGHKIEKKHLTLTTQSNLSDFSVYADPVLLRKTLCNLLRNAIEYNHNAGSISITAEKLDGNVLITISDSGKGIAEEDLPQLFKPFKRLDPKNNVNGVGIGLSLSKQMVETMGGHITVKSTLGEGSRFTISLPEATS